MFVMSYFIAMNVDFTMPILVFMCVASIITCNCASKVFELLTSIWYFDMLNENAVFHRIECH